MASSPLQLGNHTSFEDFFSSNVEPLATFGASSPIQSGMHATFNFDPTAPSPYAVLGKTPTARIRRGGGDYLVSPLATAPHGSLQARITTHNGKEKSTPLLSYRQHSNKTPVTVVEHDNASTWENDHSGMSNIDFSAALDQLEQQAAFSHSPAKAPPSQNVSGTPVAMTLPDLTPTHSPQMLSAPSTIARKPQRSVTGIDSPSVHRSGGGRMRQVTYDASSVPVSPSFSRRQTDPTTSTLANSIPHPRIATTSSSLLEAPPFSQDRVVSGASVMTTSTSYEVMSPNFAAFAHDFNMQQSQCLPELDGSQHPSPQVSAGRSPICTPPHHGGVFYTSPEEEQAPFTGHEQQQQPDISLMGGVSQIMGNSMSNANSLPDYAGQPSLRQSGLSTIAEGPSMSHDVNMAYQSRLGVPTQPGMSSQSQFQQVPYPAVPGINQPFGQDMSTTSHPIDIQSWSNQTYNINTSMPPMYGFTSQAPMQRHASASFLNYQPQPAGQRRLAAPPVAHRSVSAPYEQPVQSSMPSMSAMPMSLTAGGLFGPSDHAESSLMAQMETTLFDDAPPMPPYNRVHSADPSTTASPETPRKRKVYPRIGNPLRPGPKPKPRTPRHGKESSSAPESCSSPGAVHSGIDPNLLAGSLMSRIDEGAHLSMDVGPSRSVTSPKPAPALVFGPDLATVAAMQRTASGNPLLPQSAHPRLVIQPPRTNMGEGSVAGLPRSFLEKLYTTFLTLDGSMTGQPRKRFKCLIEGCERHFPRKSAIHSHIQTHLEDKPFICNAEDW